MDLNKLEHHLGCPVQDTPWSALAAYSLEEATWIAAGLAPCCRELFFEDAGRFQAELDTVNTYRMVMQRAVYAKELLPCRIFETEGQVDMDKTYVARAALSKWLEWTELPLIDSERRSLLTLVRAMAEAAYTFKGGKRAPIKEIKEDIERAGVKPIDDDTIRKWLREATQLPQRGADA